MEKPGEMTTLTRVLERLHERGFDHELKMSDHGRLQNSDSQKIYDPEDLTIIKVYRFEGESDPGDSSVLYLMEDKDGEKSYVMDVYGTYATESHEGTSFDDFLKKIKVEDREEQLIYG
ncbi:hypothetical protein SAMN05660909_00455 [Chitinophaga terrae (ex Kim and Jung 2007)]|uniref:Phosphoribosylpyrophosphate synthetase n=2 Tax=Chitinophaga terrae (ex Kim and Jung 2007) TaxID=408074 RepID=A0A1H3XRP5_9BACT|nr:hypothetical protein [Chitinophaga terrae (ex Kim and Jung 2007)]MDQ0105679.1 hypothetical protein [Chitinophaga terrae (ex Kim and Jung 2007)]GEP89353.1 hypothetical protein CTE07_09980 [Chitinophaga terrae (ex Kim and Jung 2007)]SEA02135.1 hypothetical protein SAMN05660909_00455 [Chitinophaga terrae (ex Kim and Jung 2007)]